MRRCRCRGAATFLIAVMAFGLALKAGHRHDTSRGASLRIPAIAPSDAVDCSHDAVHHVCLLCLAFHASGPASSPSLCAPCMVGDVLATDVLSLHTLTLAGFLARAPPS